MDYKNIFYPESRFGDFTDVDGTIAFYLRVNALLSPSAVALDVGCGRGAYAEDPIPLHRELRVLKGKCARVIGLDVDEDARQNPFLDEFHLIQGKAGERWPVEDGSIDVCVCDFVVEHVADPRAFFAECRRVLKRGGVLCIRTPNALNYIALASRAVPNKLHAKVLGRVQENREARDVFPTLYRCNTRSVLQRSLTRHGFESAVYGYEADPAYLSFSRVAYAVGVAHQKLAPGALKATLFAFARKIR